MKPSIPENYIIGEVSGDGDSFFRSVAQGLEQVRGGTFNEKMLRQECRKYAQHCTALVKTIGDLKIQDYVEKIQRCANESQSPILGRAEIEGQIISSVLNVKIYIIENHGLGNLESAQEGKPWLYRIVEEKGYGTIEHIDYEVAEAIYIFKVGDVNFKPILKRIPECNSRRDARDCVEMKDADDQNCEYEAYELREGTSGAGGHFYEIKLLMLFFLRLQITDRFYLAKNMAKVGAFDDVVFKYQTKDKDGNRASKTIFLQAKHGDKSEGCFITLDSLLSPKGAFSLKKYFESHRAITTSFKSSNGPIFNGKLEESSFVIFTNYILEPLPATEKGMENFNARHISNPDRWITKEVDGIVIAEGKGSKVMNITADINRDIITKLCCSPLQQLAQEIYNCIFGNKPKEGIRIENEIIKEYHICLANEVFTVNRNKPSDSKFRDTFIEGNRLWNELYKIARNSESMNDISNDEFQEKLNEARVNLFKTFGNIQLNLKREIFDNLVTVLADAISHSDLNIIKIDSSPKGINKLANNVLVPDNANEWVQFCKMEKLTGQAKEFMTALLKKIAEISERNYSTLTNVRFNIEGFPRFSLPGTDEDVTEHDVKQFLSKLEFALGQTKENNLDDVSKKEIQKLQQVKNEDVDIIYQSVKNLIETWWKTGNYFLTRANKFVENASVSIAHFKLSAFGNKTGIEKTRVSFTETVVNQFNDFIGQTQILNIIADKGTTLLSSVKVRQTLDQTSGDKSYIFVQLNHLLYILDYALQIFQTDATRHYMIIENNSSYRKEYTWSEEDFTKLYGKLNNIVRKDKRKNVVLVTEKDDTLPNYFTHDMVNYRKVYDNINLNHLTIPCQEKLMGREVMLHGKILKMRDLFGFQSENVNSAITSQTIMRIMKNDNLIISNAPQRLSDLDAAYTKVYEKLPTENLVRELKNSYGKNTIFVISGIKEPRSGTLQEKLINLLQITDPGLERDIRQRIGLHDERNDDKNIIVIGNAKEADPLKEFRQICSNRSDNIIYWLEITGEHVRLQQCYEPNFYIKRKFVYAEKTALNVKLILQKNSKALFIFNDAADREKIEKLIKDMNVEYQRRFQNNCKSKTIRFATSESHAEMLFRELNGAKDYEYWLKLNGPALEVQNRNQVLESDYDFKETRTVHWLQMLGDGNEQMVWKKSHGSFQQLRHYIDEQKREMKFYTEGEFNKEIQDKVVIIADEPGMGKTTNLTSESQQMLDDNWVIRVNFLDCKDAIETLPDAYLNFEDVYNFVAKVESAGLKNDFAKKLMLCKLDPREHHRRPILIMFDGYDEISSEEQNKIIPLLQFIKWQTAAKIWVTTRLNLMDALENSLSAFATKFEPLVLEEQKEFLNRFWRVRLAPLLKHKNTEAKIGIYTSELLHESADILGKTISRIMGVPLQLRLLAEGLMREVVSYLNGCDNQNPKFDHLNVLKLYHTFIDEKYEIYIREKMRIGKIPPSIRRILVSGFDKHHEKSAMHLLFPEHQYLEGIGNEEVDDLKSVGIIQSLGREGKPYFIHRTFAEYFAAKFLAGCLKVKKTDSKKYKQTTRFLINHIFEERNRVIQEFLDHMLSEGFPIHIATLANKLRDVMDLTKDLTQPIGMDNLGRTALHLAAHNGHLNIVKVLLDNGYNALSSDALGKTALHYATMNNHKVVVEHLLSYNADIDIGDNVFATPLHADMEIGNNLFRDEYSSSSLVAFVNQKDIESKTALHYVTEITDLKIACALISHGANINLCSSELKKKLIFKIVGKIGYIHILLLLLIHYPVEVYFDNRNSNWVTILGIFISFGHTKAIDAILGNTTTPDSVEILQSLSSDVKYRTHCSDEDNLKVVKYLFGKCKNDSFLRNFGVTAARNGHLETVKYILKYTLKYTVKQTLSHFLKQEKKYNVDEYVFGAIEWGQQNIVMYLFENYSKYITTDVLKTALYTAVKYNRLGIIKYLVKKGADVNARNEGKSLLQYAVEENSTIVIPCLVKNGAVNIYSGEFGHTIQDYVEMCFPNYKFQSMQYDVMDNLIKISEVHPNVAGLTDYTKVANIIMHQVQNNVNSGNEHGTTLLHIAASFRTMSLANYLIKHGADVNIKDREGKTPLHKAVQTYCREGGRNKETIMHLLEHGAIYDQKDENNATVLDYFIQSQTNNDPVFNLLNLIDMLFKNQCENFEEIVNTKLHILEMLVIHCAKNSEGNTILHVFAGSGNVKMVSMFINNGCPFNSRNNENKTPKDLALKNSHKNVVEIIQSIENAFMAIKDNKKFEIEPIFKQFPIATDEEGKMMFDWAAEYGNVGIAELLIKNGVNIHKSDYRGWTPLHYAAKNDQIQIIKLLLYHSAKFNAKNFDRKSPLQVATGKSLNFLEQVNEIFNAIQTESPEIANKHLKSMQKDYYEAFVAAINCTDNFRNALFNYVVESNDLELVLLLLQNGTLYDEFSTWGAGSKHNIYDNQISVLLRFIDQLFKWEKQLIYSHDTVEQCPTKLQLIRNCRGRHGNTILHKAAEYPVNYNRLRFLIKHNVDINATNKRGFTVLDWAIEKSNLDLVKFLLKNNVNVNKLTPDNKQKLMEAAAEKRPDIVELFNLLENV